MLRRPPSEPISPNSDESNASLTRSFSYLSAYTFLPFNVSIENKSPTPALIFKASLLTVPSTPPSPKRVPSLPKKESAVISNFPAVRSFRKPVNLEPPGIAFIVAPIVLPTTLTIPEPISLTMPPALVAMFIAPFKKFPIPDITAFADPIIVDVIAPNIPPRPGKINDMAICPTMPSLPMNLPILPAIFFMPLPIFLKTFLTPLNILLKNPITTSAIN